MAIQLLFILILTHNFLTYARRRYLLKSGHQSRPFALIALAAMVVATARFCLCEGLIAAGHALRGGTDSDSRLCNALAVVTALLYDVATLLVELFMWLRQRHLYANVAFRPFLNAPTRCCSWAALALLGGTKLGKVVVLVTRSWQRSSALGCVGPVDVDLAPNIALGCAEAASQLALLALFVQPLLRDHRVVAPLGRGFSGRDREAAHELLRSAMGATALVMAAKALCFAAVAAAYTFAFHRFTVVDYLLYNFQLIAYVVAVLLTYNESATIARSCGCCRRYAGVGDSRDESYPMEIFGRKTARRYTVARSAADGHSRDYHSREDHSHFRNEDHSGRGLL